MAEESAVKGRLRVTFCRWRSTLSDRKRLSHNHDLDFQLHQAGGRPHPIRHPPCLILDIPSRIHYLSRIVPSPSFEKNLTTPRIIAKTRASHIFPQVYGDMYYPHVILVAHRRIHFTPGFITEPNTNQNSCRASPSDAGLLEPTLFGLLIFEETGGICVDKLSHTW